MPKSASMMLAVAILLSTGVAAKAPNFSPSDFGEAPRDPVEGARVYMQTKLKDPYSAQYQLLNVFTGYCNGGWARGGGIAWSGWAANIAVNAKNSYGGYTGYETHTFLFQGGDVVNEVEGENFGAYGPAKGFLGLDGGAGVCKRL